MPGMRVVQSLETLAPDETDRVVGISQTIYSGDPVVLTSKATIATLNSVNMPSLRSLLQADITALYKEGVPVAGILGVAGAGVKTDANAAATSALPSAVSVAGAQVILPVPSVSSALEPEPSQGRARCRVQLANQNNLIAAPLWETTALTDALIGVQVGILLSTIGGVPFYFWSTAAATPIGVIQQINRQDPLFNTTTTANVQNTTHNPRAEVYVQVLPAYQQFNTGVNYSTN